MMDHTLALMTGNDIPVPELQLVIHSPTIKEIALMGEAEFFMAAQYLCLDKETLIQDKNVSRRFTNFQVLMKVLGQPKGKEKKVALSMLLTILFPQHHPAIMPKSIILSSGKEGEEPILIDDSNFEVLQEIAKEVMCLDSIFSNQGNYNPQGKRAKEIADKIKAANSKIAKQKQEKGESDGVLTRYLSILSVGAGMRLEDCINYNLFQLFDLMGRYTAYMEWDADMRVRLAGGKPEKQVESWMRNLHSMK